MCIYMYICVYIHIYFMRYYLYFSASMMKCLQVPGRHDRRGGLYEELAPLGDARAGGGRQRRRVGVRRAVRATLLLLTEHYVHLLLKKMIFFKITHL